MQNDKPEPYTTEPLIPHGRLKTDRPPRPCPREQNSLCIWPDCGAIKAACLPDLPPAQNDNPEPYTTAEIQRLGDLIRMIEANIEERETAIRVIRKERSKLVAQRYRLQKAAGLK